MRIWKKSRTSGHQERKEMAVIQCNVSLAQNEQIHNGNTGFARL